MLEVTREGFPKIDLRDEGRLVPYIFGHMKRYQGIGAVVGATDVVSADMTASQTWVDLTSIDDLSRFDRAGGTIQIDTERMSYPDNSINYAGLKIYNLTRGVSGSAAATHNRGATCYEVLGTHVYILCENPKLVTDPAHGFKTLGVPQVYLDGYKKAPTDPPNHTVSLDDRSLDPNRSFVTITFDMTTIPVDQFQPPSNQPLQVGPAPSPINPSPTAPSSSPIPQPSPVAAPPPPTAYGSDSPTGSAGIGTGGIPISSGFGFGNPGGSASYGAVTVLLALGLKWLLAHLGWIDAHTWIDDLAYMIPIMGVSAPGNTPAPPIVRNYRTPVIGQAEADVDGLTDDSVGTITGQAFTFMDRPMWIVRTIMREAWKERNDARYELSSFNDAHLNQVNKNIVWAMAYDGMGFAQFRDQALLEGLAQIIQERSLWRYVFRGIGTPVLNFTDRESGGAGGIRSQPIFSRTVRTNLTTQLIVTFGLDRTHRLTFTSTRGQKVAGLLRNRNLALKWCDDVNQATFLGNYWLGQWDLQRTAVTLETTWWSIPLNAWDRFTVDHPVVVPWGARTLQFNATGFHLDPHTMKFTIEGLEAEPGLAPVSPGSGGPGGGPSVVSNALTFAGTYLSGRWRVATANAVHLHGQWVVKPIPAVIRSGKWVVDPQWGGSTDWAMVPDGNTPLVDDGG